MEAEMKNETRVPAARVAEAVVGLAAELRRKPTSEELGKRLGIGTGAAEKAAESAGFGGAVEFSSGNAPLPKRSGPPLTRDELARYVSDCSAEDGAAPGIARLREYINGRLVAEAAASGSSAPLARTVPSRSTLRRYVDAYGLSGSVRTRRRRSGVERR